MSTTFSTLGIFLQMRVFMQCQYFRFVLWVLERPQRHRQDGVHYTPRRISIYCHFMWRLWDGLGWGSRVAGLLSRGFSFVDSLARRFRVIYSDTLSARDVGGCCSTPHGLLTARVLVNGGSALPRVSTSLLVLRQSSPGIARLLSHRLVSAEPRALTATRPLGHSLVFPNLDVRRVYLVDSFIARDPQHNAHTTSLVLTLSGHTFSG